MLEFGRSNGLSEVASRFVLHATVESESVRVIGISASCELASIVCAGTVESTGAAAPDEKEKT